MSIEWCESAIVLAARPHGESSLIATLLTQSHGTHAGLVQRARGRTGSLQPGNRVQARWRARQKPNGQAQPRHPEALWERSMQ